MKVWNQIRNAVVESLESIRHFRQLVIVELIQIPYEEGEKHKDALPGIKTYTGKAMLENSESTNVSIPSRQYGSTGTR